MEKNCKLWSRNPHEGIKIGERGKYGPEFVKYCTHILGQAASASDGKHLCAAGDLGAAALNAKPAAR